MEAKVTRRALPELPRLTPEQQPRPLSNIPGPHQLLQKVRMAKSTEELESKCDFFFREVRLVPNDKMYANLHDIENLAVHWVFTEKAGHAMIIFSKLNTYLEAHASAMTHTLLQKNGMVAFEQKCRASLMDAVSNKSGEELKQVILDYTRRAQSLLTVGRLDYVDVIQTQLVELGCIDEKIPEKLSHATLLQLCEDLNFCAETAEIGQSCDFLLTQACFANTEEQHQIYYELEKIAAFWMLTERCDHARMIFSKLNTDLKFTSEDINATQLQTQHLKDFRDNCSTNFNSAPKDKNKLKQFAVEHKEIAQELLLLGRPEYAKVIYQQLMVCGCLNQDDKEALTYINLIEKKQTRKDVQSSAVTWARDGDRKASKYAHALIVLSQSGLSYTNVATAIMFMAEAEKAGYEPAKQALLHLNGLNGRLEQDAAAQLARKIASEAGFNAGFNDDEKSIYKI